MRRTMTLLAGILLATPVFAGMTNDRLCQAIGDTPNVSVPPQDRTFACDEYKRLTDVQPLLCKRKTDATCSW
jgi:hypothetical protein